MASEHFTLCIDNSFSITSTRSKKIADQSKIICATATVDGSLTITQLRSGSHTLVGTPIVASVFSGIKVCYRILGDMVSTLKFEYVVGTQTTASIDIMYHGDVATNDAITIFDSEGHGITAVAGALKTTYPSAMMTFNADALNVNITNAQINVDICVSDKVMVYGQDPDDIDAQRPLEVNSDGNLKVTGKLYSGNGTAIKDYNGGLIISRGLLEQANYIDVSQALSITSSNTFVHSLSVVNMRNDSVAYLKLYDLAGDPVPVTHTPAATYALFPQKLEHLTWSNGLYFANGLSALCTLHAHATDASYVNSGECHIHLSYTGGV
jgi:hypothetical protein